MIKLFLTDLDGCLTDGGYYVFSDQEGIAKKFNTRDFHGMMLLAQSGVKIGVITLSRGVVFAKQLERVAHLFPITFYPQVSDKYTVIKERYVDTGEMEWEEIAFIGDDENDIELLKHVGLAACPLDAEESVRKEVYYRRADGWVMDRPGGFGCVREFANLVADLNGIIP